MQDWLRDFFGNFSSSQATPTTGVKKASAAKKKPVISTNNTKKAKPNEITPAKELTDEQIATQQTRAKYITVKNNPDYKVKSGDNIYTIAKKFGVEERLLMELNGLTKETASKIKIGQTLKIPPTRRAKNVKNLNDVAKTMGLSPTFIKNIKYLEDGPEYGYNKFRNTPFPDAGVYSIGIGHVLQPGDPKRLSDQQVCEYFANDLLRMEDNLIAVLGKKNYEKLPQPMKEALLDMVFNKGTAIIEDTPGFLYCLKSGKYEAAINFFTNNKTATTNEERSGLSKRRLFEISVASNIYKGKVPDSNVKTAQNVYNRGVQLLREECKKKNLDFKSTLVGYNKDIQNYFGDRIKIKYITA